MLNLKFEVDALNSDSENLKLCNCNGKLTITRRLHKIFIIKSSLFYVQGKGKRKGSGLD